MLTDSRFWMGIIVGVALYYGYQRFGPGKSAQS